MVQAGKPIRGARAAVLAAAISLVATAPAAHAAHTNRPSQPVCETTAHFVIHCDGSAPSWMRAQAAVDFEESYGRLVAGGGGSPNAGLRPPVDDGDGKTDVYLRAPPDRPDFNGGTVYSDPAHTSGIGQAAYLFMTPGLSAGGFRFRAAHEFMHVIQRGYRGPNRTKYDEGTANWAAEWALPDINPLDNNFTRPELPFDCIDNWPDASGPDCGGGYWQWLFFQRQVEAFGPEFISSFYERVRAASFDGDFGLVALRDELAARTGLPASEALRARFAEYARKVWDPTAWVTTAVDELFTNYTPAKTEVRVGRDAGDTGEQSVTVDHLAARYVSILPSDVSPGDLLRITVTLPGGVRAAPDVLTGSFDGPQMFDFARETVPLAPAGPGRFSATVPFGPEDRNDIVIPLVNDTEAADGLQFGYRAQLMPRAGVEVKRQGLAKVLKKGLQLSVTCPGACSASFRLMIPRKLAEKVGLKAKGKQLTIGKLNAQGGAGTTPLRMKLSRRVRRALGDVRSVDARLSVAINAGGQKTNVTQNLRLGR